MAEDVKLEQAFPASEPTFVLVSLAKDGKSVEIGIAGGAYADGGETLKLKFGKRITLQNTADGSSYELELLAIEGFAAAEAEVAPRYGLQAAGLVERGGDPREHGCRSEPRRTTIVTSLTRAAAWAGFARRRRCRRGTGAGPGR